MRLVPLVVSDAEEFTVKLGFVGLGQMGRPLCGNLIGAGHDVHVFDTVPEAAAELVSRGAQSAASLPELGRAVEAVFLALPAPDISEAVVCGSGGLLEGLGSGSVIVEMSTVSPGLVRRLEEACRPLGVSLVDCGMSGGPKGAADAKLTFMVGGDPTPYEKVRPALEAMGSHIYHCGKTGNGMAAKLVNNALAHAHALLVCEGFSLGVKNGLDPKILYDVIETSSGMSWVLSNRFREYIQTGEYNPGMTLDLLHKDSTLAMEMAHQSETPLFLMRMANSLFTWYQLEGFGPRNWAEMMTLWENQLSIRIGSPPD